MHTTATEMLTTSLPVVDPELVRREGPANPHRRAQPNMLANFPQKLYENRENWIPTEGTRPWLPPLRMKRLS